MLTRLKKRRGLLEQIGKLESELKSLSQSEETLAVNLRSVEMWAGDQEAPTSKRNNRKCTVNITMILNTGRPWNHKAFQRVFSVIGRHCKTKDLL